MAIPVGTTARQIGALAAWLLAGVVILGALTWWSPSFHAWGAMSAGVLSTMAFWLVWGVCRNSKTVPAHGVHLALLVPAVVLTYHLALTGLGKNRTDSALMGSLNISMIYQLALLAGTVLLTQSLLPRAVRHASVLSVCGLAMTVGSAAAVYWSKSKEVHESVCLLGFSGTAVWLSAIWGLGPNEDSLSPRRFQNRWLRGVIIAVAVAGVAALAWASPMAGAIALAIAPAAVLLTNNRLAKSAWACATAVAVAGIAGAAGAAAWMAHVHSDTWLSVGTGERIFGQCDTLARGATIYAGAIGAIPTAAFFGLLAAFAAAMATCTVRRPGDRLRAIVWLTAASAATCSMFISPGGLFSPAPTLATGFTWGLMPSMLGCRHRERSGVWLLLASAALMFLLGLSRSDGLVAWCVISFGGGDAQLHFVCGLLPALAVAWTFGQRWTWLGLAGIVVMGLLGGAAEWIQGAFSKRGVDMVDWVWHSVGCAAAIVPYLLARASRGSESADARRVHIPD